MSDAPGIAAAEDRAHGGSPSDYDHGHDHGNGHDHGHGHGHGHGHSHRLVDPSIMRSRAGVRVVLSSLALMGATAAIQTAIYIATGSVALLADLIHNFGDALTAVPLGIAFLLRSVTAEKRAGLFVVLAIFVSACAAFVEATNRLINPQSIGHLWVLAAAGVIGLSVTRSRRRSACAGAGGWKARR